MDIERISATEEAILDVLACYRFLTPNQMFRLGVTAAKPHLYATLRKLQIRKPAVISVLDFGALPRRGRLSRLYALTPYGAEVAADARRDGEIIETPKRIRAFVNDYFHRLACLDFHIALRAWAERSETTINFFHTYYDPQLVPMRRRSTARKPRLSSSEVSLFPMQFSASQRPTGPSGSALLKCIMAAGRIVSQSNWQRTVLRKARERSRRHTDMPMERVYCVFLRIRKDYSLSVNVYTHRTLLRDTICFSSQRRWEKWMATLPLVGVISAALIQCRSFRISCCLC